MTAKRTGLVLVANLLAIFAGTAAQASPEFNYFEEYAYQDAMMRCVATLRPVLEVQDTDTVSYIIQEIDLKGPWYRFEISATVLDSEGNTQIDDFQVGCKANRWIDETRLLARRNAESLILKLDLLARNR